MTALKWGILVWIVFAVPWAIGFGSAGWKAGQRAGVDPAMAATVAWALGPLAFPIIARWRRVKAAGDGAKLAGTYAALQTQKGLAAAGGAAVRSTRRLRGR